MASSQQFCLRWNNHQSTLISVFDHLLESGTLVDCTLAAEGQSLKAHKVVLSACSPYLEALLSQHYEKHPIIILKDVTFQELKSMLDYMYRGEVNISQEQLGTFLKAAESLQIKGLTENGTINESKDLERARDLEQLRELQSVGMNRALGLNIPILPKRMDVARKQIPIAPRARSPLIGLPSNYMTNLDSRKNNKHTIPSEIGSSNDNKNREGSVSPTVKRKRTQASQQTQVEEKSNQLTKLLENNHSENHIDNKRKDSYPQKHLSNSVPSTRFNPEEKKVNNSSVENSENGAVVKCEVKQESVDFTDEMQNEDSVGDLTVDEEEEEMEEMDLSQPGPSSSANSSVAGIPWHLTVGEGNGDDSLLAQPDSQGGGAGGGRKYLSTLLPNWESWSALHPSVPNLLRGALSYPPSSTPGDSEPKGVECGKCGRHYKLKSSLRNHQKWECGKEPQFQCPYCNYKAKQKMHVARHIERMHREKLDMLESIHDRSIKEDAVFQQDAV